MSKTKKCGCIGCGNDATHTWSGHPTCDECAVPVRQRKKENDMNEQQKRELMLRAAVHFNGVWPSEFCDMLVLYKGEILASKSDGLGRVEVFDSIGLCIGRVDVDCVFCVRSEFEAFIDSLFEGAPEDVTHHGGTLEYPHWYKRINGAWCFNDKKDSRWHVAFSFGSGSQKECDLIPRPRKQEVEQAKWAGEGLPPVGFTHKDCELVGVCGFESGFEVVAHKEGKGCRFAIIWGEHFDDDEGHTCTMLESHFRPLKTEAEKERESLYHKAKAVIKEASYDPEISLPTLNAIDALIDAGWRPND